MARRPFDAYYTEAGLTTALLVHAPIEGSVYEPCAGQQHISTLLRKDHRITSVTVNDLAWTSYGQDARTWFPPRQFDWVISNPPFNHAYDIITQTWRYVDRMAWLLRLSWLEPTDQRGAWLAANPPTQLIVLPRVSFTGDGKTDSVTCAWMIWERGAAPRPHVTITKAQLRALQTTADTWPVDIIAPLVYMVKPLDNAPLVSLS